MAQEGTGRELVLLESAGAVRIITLNRPEKLNAADLEMQRRLVSYLNELAEDQAARALILTGAGRAFSAGGDRSILEKMAKGKFDQQEEFARVHFDTIDAFLNLSIPSVAAVNGPAVGYAAGLVAMCDMVVMGEEAFLCDPHVKFGVAATTATQLIWPKLTSQVMAREILMTGRQVGAREAVDIGLANRLCPKGRELETAREMAAAFVGLPARGVAATKRAFNQTLIDEVQLLHPLMARLASDEGR